MLSIVLRSPESKKAKKPSDFEVRQPTAMVVEGGVTTVASQATAADAATVDGRVRHLRNRQRALARLRTLASAMSGGV